MTLTNGDPVGKPSHGPLQMAARDVPACIDYRCDEEKKTVELEQRIGIIA
jgi:hypothetical protein